MERCAPCDKYLAILFLSFFLFPLSLLPCCFLFVRQDVHAHECKFFFKYFKAIYTYLSNNS